MAQKTLVGGTAYELKVGKCLVGGTAYSIKKGRTLVGGTGYDVAFGTPIGNLAVGTSIYLRENGSPVEYFVVHQGIPDATLYQSACKGTWIMRKKIHSLSAINAVPYHASSLHIWFDSTFTPQFDAATQSKMKLMRLPWLKENRTPVSGDSGFLVRIFLPSHTEIGIQTSDSGQYPSGSLLSYFERGSASTANAKRVAYQEDGTAYSWWTRSAFYRDNLSANYAYYARANGSSAETYASAKYGVRPCMILDPSATVGSSMELLA